MASARFDSLMASVTTPTISKSTGRMTINFLPELTNSEEARNQKKIDITRLVCKLQTKIPKSQFLEMQLLGMLTELTLKISE